MLGGGYASKDSDAYSEGINTIILNSLIEGSFRAKATATVPPLTRKTSSPLRQNLGPVPEPGAAVETQPAVRQGRWGNQLIIAGPAHAKLMGHPSPASPASAVPLALSHVSS